MHRPNRPVLACCLDLKSVAVLDLTQIPTWRNLFFFFLLRDRMKHANTRHQNARSQSHQAPHRPGYQNRAPRLLPATAELVIIRGLPGSGKSTLANRMVEQGYQHFEADMYFMQDGVYRYDASRVREAHNWCKTMTRSALVRGDHVVVANTFTRLTEMQPYFDMCGNVRVIEATGRWLNVHGVPPARIQQMAERWEPFACAERLSA